MPDITKNNSKKNESSIHPPKQGRQRYVSLKWKLLAICILLVTVPTSFLGILGYTAFKAHLQSNNETLLRTIALDWHQIADTYIDQVDRVLRREEILTRQRLKSIVLSIAKTIALYPDTPSNPIHEPDYFNQMSKKISALEIGRSGFAFLADQDGRIFSTKNSQWRNKNLQELLNNSKIHTGDLLNQVKFLGKDESKIFYFQTPDKDTGKLRHQMAALHYFEKWNIFIGALIYLTDFKSYELEKKLQDTLRYRIAEQKIGGFGYIWVFNSNGDFIVSHDRMRDGENIINYRDKSGNFFIRNIIDKAKKLQKDETHITYYPWKNLMEKEESRKVAAITYVPQWDWIIGASSYEKDYFKGLAKVRLQFVLICVIAIILGSGIGYIFALVISRPIQRLRDLSLQAANGQLDVTVDEKTLQQPNEIGGLATSFQKMTTNLRQLIEEKEEINSTLLGKNKELALAKKKLEKSVETAEQLTQEANQANEAKSTFLANMSHELRTPLNVILGYAQLLSTSQKVEQECRSHSRIIMESGNHLLMMINDILDIAKIEAKKLEFHISEVNFVQFLEDISKMIELEAKQKEISFVRAFQKDLPPAVRADEKRLKQVLLNILNNGVKFTDSGSVIFEVKVVPEVTKTPGKVMIYFSISDTGSGIPDYALTTIFKPFEQVKYPKEIQSGTGLGLAISNEIVSRMGGSLEVESKVGQGSRFYFALEFEPIETFDATRNIVSDYHGYKGEKQKILVVDDMESNRTLICQILETFHFEAHEASGGPQALNMLEEIQPCLVLLDLNMPEMDGYEVMRRMRQKYTNSQLKIIILSGNVGPMEQQRCQESGADDFLAKPIDLNALLTILKNNLNLVWLAETDTMERK